MSARQAPNENDGYQYQAAVAVLNKNPGPSDPRGTLGCDIPWGRGWGWATLPNGVWIGGKFQFYFIFIYLTLLFQPINAMRNGHDRTDQTRPPDPCDCRKGPLSPATKILPQSNRTLVSISIEIHLNGPSSTPIYMLCIILSNSFDNLF